MQNLLIIDTETNGIEPKQNSVIEIGVILYSCDYQTTLAQLSYLLYAPDNAAETINHISPEALGCLPDFFQDKSLDLLQEMSANAAYAIAHNADFDQQWFGNNQHLPTLKDCNGQPIKWLCTMDMTWPKQSKPGESLVSLALNHGIGVSSAHRALTDCQLLAELFTRLSAEQLSQQLTEALKPRAYFQAQVSYEERQLAKEAGFRWNGKSKAWTRKMPIEETKALPFAVVQL